MKKLFFLIFLTFLYSQTFAYEFVIKESRFNGETTVNKIVKILKNKGLKIFTIIDHQKAAEEYGLKMPFEKVIIFGNPKVGTKFMLENPVVGIELPLKILVYSRKGKTYLVYKSPMEIEKEYKLQRYHKFFIKLGKGLKKITDMVSK